MIISLCIVILWMIAELALDLLVPDLPDTSVNASFGKRVYDFGRLFRQRARLRLLRLTCFGESLRGARKRLVQAFNLTSDGTLIVSLIFGLPIVFVVFAPFFIWALGAYSRALFEGDILEADNEARHRAEMQFLDVSKLKPGDARFKPAVTSPAQATCAVCGDDLKYGVIYCEDCGTPQHYDCWRYLTKCSVYGCGCSTFRVENPAAKKV